MGIVIYFNVYISVLFLLLPFMVILFHGYILLLAILLSFFYFLLKSKIFAQSQQKDKIDSDDLVSYEESRKIVEDLDRLMQSEKLYLYTELELRQVAYIIDISEDKIVRALWKVEQHSFEKYLDDLRINEACDILLIPELELLDIHEIALECGFRDGEELEIIFKEKIGVTPDEYRERYSYYD
ncbi:helix-turn-helix domain-containing protein [Zunongwangia sp.]|uniref:helix-turn-helix domain-containing protein n=1 Tax=Zunongwangia sp. TaxID=1965325 RepID=UPI003AA95889